MKIAFSGPFAARFAEAVRRTLSIPAGVVLSGEAELGPALRDVDVPVPMAFSAAVAEAPPLRPELAGKTLETSGGGRKVKGAAPDR